MQECVAVEEEPGLPALSPFEVGVAVFDASEVVGGDSEDLGGGVAVHKVGGLSLEHEAGDFAGNGLDAFGGEGDSGRHGFLVSNNRLIEIFNGDAVADEDFDVVLDAVVDEVGDLVEVVVFVIIDGANGGAGFGVATFVGDDEAAADVLVFEKYLSFHDLCFFLGI